MQSHYSNINSHDYTTFTYDCTCTDSGTYAYVYPDDFGHIYLCGAFWDAPNTGTDSRAGTLIHEVRLTLDMMFSFARDIFVSEDGDVTRCRHPTSLSTVVRRITCTARVARSPSRRATPARRSSTQITTSTSRRTTPRSLRLLSDTAFC